jgi:hypothetical protein
MQQVTMTEISKNIVQIFQNFPIWGIFLITLGIIFAAFEVGFLLGRYRYNRLNKEKDSLVGPMVGVMLGLLAFMLSFTFGVAASHFDARRQLVLEEANTIRSTYAMTDMLAEVPRTESQKLLREYVDLRLKKYLSQDEIDVALSRSHEIHDQLWSMAMTGETKSTGTSSSWLYVQSLSDMINMQAKRLIAGTHGRIQTSIWVMLYCLAILGMAAMGYHAGLVGIRGFFVYPVLILMFSLVVVFIYDLDRPKQSLFKVSQQPIIELQQRMNEIAVKRVSPQPESSWK